MIDLLDVNSDDSYVSEDWLKKVEKETKIDLDKEIEEPRLIVSMGEYTNYRQEIKPIPLMTEGEFSVISAPSKTKKTFLKSALVSSYIGGQSSNYFDFKGHRKDNTETILDIDTEQGGYYAQRTFKRVERMVGNRYENYIPFHLRMLKTEERVMFIEQYLKEYAIKKNIKLVMIDGIADLLTDSNDLVMSNEVVEKIMTWTEKYQIHICVIIHNAYGSEKPTGHLGSAITKKAETVMFLSKDETESRITNVKCGYSRGISFDDLSFEIGSYGLPKQVDTMENEIEDKDSPIF